MVITLMCIFMTGCFAKGKMPQLSTANTALAEGNYRVIKANARGTDSGFALLGIIPFSTPSYADAMKSLHEKVSMEGRATSLINVTEDKSLLYLILFSVPRLTITADVIEFTE
jgi:hypothetical protein